MELHIFTEPQQGAHQQDLLAVARLSERLGFAGFFRSDHVMTIGSPPNPPGPTDAWVSLGEVAGATSRIRLGTLMTAATFRLPGVLAVAVAQVDQMSQGRVDFGFGAGWYEAEHRAYGIPFPSLRERMDRFDEQLQVITGLWATPEGGTFDFQGRYYRLEACPALPRPVQRPGPPVLMGGMGHSRTPRLAARFATEFNCAFVPLAAAAAQFERVKSACAAAGRDPASMRFSVALTLCCGQTEPEFQRRAKAIRREPEELRRIGLGGLVDEVIDRLGEVRELGCERAYLQVLDLHDLEHLELIAERVLPGAA